MDAADSVCDSGGSGAACGFNVGKLSGYPTDIIDVWECFSAFATPRIPCETSTQAKLEFITKLVDNIEKVGLVKCEKW